MQMQQLFVVHYHRSKEIRLLSEFVFCVPHTSNKTVKEENGRCPRMCCFGGRGRNTVTGDCARYVHRRVPVATILGILNEDVTTIWVTG